MSARLAIPIAGMCVAMFVVTIAAIAPAAEPAAGSAEFHLIVMDPLAEPLSCPCVEGYAQRKYEALAEHLEAATMRKVRLTFANVLAEGLKESGGRADLIIGKDSVVRASADAAEIKLAAVAALSDKTGSTEQHGLIVVRHDDTAQTPAELSGYEIIFGPAAADEKHAAAMELLEEAGVAIPAELTIDEACSDGACKVVEFGSQQRVAAVISSYAAPLLEGCGTIEKGDLRVVATTRPVPFITAFVDDSLPRVERQAIQEALFAVVESPDLCEKLESLAGFVEPAKKKSPTRQPS